MQAESDDVGDVQSIDIGRSKHEVETHPLQGSKLQLENVEIREQEDPHSDIVTTSQEKVEPQTARKTNLNKDQKRSVIDRLHKEIMDYEMATGSIIDLMKRTMDEIVGIVHTVEVAIQQSPHGTRWKKLKIQMENFIQKYEQICIELKTILSGIAQSLIERTQEIKTAGKNQLKASVDEND